MQTVVQVVCNRGRSLRDVIANDRKLTAHHLAVVPREKAGPLPWMDESPNHRRRPQRVDEHSMGRRHQHPDLPRG